jgi:ferredoxin
METNNPIQGSGVHGAHGAAAPCWAVLPVLCLLLPAAHHLRFGQPGLVLLWICMAGLFLTRQAWARTVIMFALASAGLLWAHVGAQLVALRLAMGTEWLRPALIMSGLFGLTLCSMAQVHGRAARRWFSLGEGDAGPAAAAFLLSCGLLGLLHERAGLELLLLERYFPGYGWFEVFVLASYAAAVTRRLLDPGTAPRTRSLIWSLFSLVFFAQLFLGLLGAERMLMTGSLHLPVPALILAGPLYRGEGFFMLLLFLVSVVLAGPAWCSHLCYIGAWDDRVSRLSGSIRPLPGWTPRLRWAILLLVLASAILLRLSGLPSGVALTAAVLFGLTGLLVMALFSARTGTMVHCTLYCPVGLASNLLGRISPWRMRLGPGCTSCGRCSMACRYNALSPADLERGRPGLSCTLCGDCVSACPHRVMGYRFPGLAPSTARSAFLVLIVVLHAVFLGVARL